MIIKYIQEYVAIAMYFQKHEESPAIIKKTEGTVTVKRSIVEMLLDKNAYDTSHNKLRLWKALCWINVDGNSGQRLTKMVYDLKTKKSVRGIQINLSVANTLQKYMGNTNEV